MARPEPSVFGKGFSGPTGAGGSEALAGTPYCSAMPAPVMTPDLESLELFRLSVELGSISSAAAVRGISQPAASSRIRALEAELGLTLLRRRPTGSVPTDSGRLVAQWASEVAEATTRFAVSVEALRTTSAGHLRVAASYTIAEYLMPAWLNALRTAQPNAAVQLEVSNSARVVESVTNGTADVGFIESPGSPQHLAIREVGTDDLVVVVAPGHPWSRRSRSLSISRLASTPLVVREVGSGTREALEHALAMHGLVLATPALELGSTTAVKRAVTDGVAPAVISWLTVAADVEERRLTTVEIEGLDLGRTLRAVWLPGAEVTGLAAVLLRQAISIGR